MSYFNNTDSEKPGAIQLGSAAATLVASTDGVVTAYTAIGTITLEPVLDSDKWTVARRNGGNVTRTVPMALTAARRVFGKLMPIPGAINWKALASR